jgi:hypothetical protein
LAHRIDRKIRSGELRDWADAARLVGVTRARMTQISNLLLLAPEIQEAILMLAKVIEGKDPLTEHDLRTTAGAILWMRQRELLWPRFRSSRYSLQLPAGIPRSLGA